MNARDEALIKYRQANPCLTLLAVGNKFDITKERVRQILSSNSQPTHRLYPHNLCLNCGQPTRRKLYCNRKCQHEYCYPLMECAQCGTLSRRRAKELISHISYGQKKERLFCGRRCQGKWGGEYYGFKPGHKGHKGNLGKRKYNESTIYDCWQETGFGARKLSRILKIPCGTVSKYLRRFRDKQAAPGNWNGLRRKEAAHRVMNPCACP